jgi:hypothetical protein
MTQLGNTCINLLQISSSHRERNFKVAEITISTTQTNLNLFRPSNSPFTTSVLHLKYQPGARSRGDLPITVKRMGTALFS